MYLNKCECSLSDGLTCVLDWWSRCATPNFPQLKLREAVQTCEGEIRGLMAKLIQVPRVGHDLIATQATSDRFLRVGVPSPSHSDLGCVVQDMIAYAAGETVQEPSHDKEEDAEVSTEISDKVHIGRHTREEYSETHKSDPTPNPCPPNRNLP